MSLDRSSPPADSPAAEPESAGTQKGPDAVAQLLGQIAEALEYLGHLAAAQIDGYKLRLRRLIVLIVLGIIGLLAAIALVVATVWLLLAGIAGGLGVAFGNRAWLGSLVTAVVILAGGGIAAWIALWRMRVAGLQKARQRYAERQASQEARFGHGVHPSEVYHQ